MVLVILPPSEGKTAATAGPTLNLQELSFPQLNDVRQQVAQALIEVCSLPEQEALTILKSGAQTLPDIRATAKLFEAPCAPAANIYTGVLYEAAHLQPDDSALIFSGLFGVTTPRDYIPLYRCAMSVNLPQVGTLSSVWKRELASLSLDALQQAAGSIDHVVFDARSSAYQVWPAKNAAIRKTASTSSEVPQDDSAFPFWTLRAINANGRTITHRAKYYRGLMARALLDAGKIANTQVEEIVHQVAQAHAFKQVSIDPLHRIITIAVA